MTGVVARQDVAQHINTGEREVRQVDQVLEDIGTLHRVVGLGEVEEGGVEGGALVGRPLK